MNSCTFMFLIVYCGAMAIPNHDDYYNVGTVLFTRSDLQKNRWSRREVQLLQARQHFQDLLPPPSFVSVRDRNSINLLLQYFDDAYTAVKREAKDSETDNIMTAAMSDVIGGYLKLWALPITKFSYYGGTADQDDTLRLYDLYDEIKSYLNTNGRGWRSPNTHLLNSVSVNVASPRTHHARETHYPCDNLAFYEKTQSGFSVPLPTIEWHKSGETMFVPLKNESLIPLSSTDKPDVLFKYYDTAKNCIPDTERTEFDAKFQDWLNSKVIPHLNDEKLYPALGSVLTLVNRTRNLCDTVIDMYNENMTMPHKQTRIAGFLIDFSSKKMMILIVIIILEIAWCIPAVCYLMCTKCKKKSKKSNIYMRVDHPISFKPLSRRKSECTSTLFKDECECEPEEVVCELPKQSSRTQGHNYPSRHNYPTRLERWNYDYDTFIENEISNHSFPNKLRTTSSEIRNMNLGSPSNVHSVQSRKKHTIKAVISKKIGTNKVLAKETSTLSYPENVYNVCSAPTTEITTNPERYPTMQQLETTKTVTLLKFRDPDTVSNRISEIIEQDRQEKDTQICLPQVISKCNQSIDKCSKTTMVSSINTDLKLCKTQTQKDMRKKGVRLVSGKPYLEITIDNRPHKEITERVSFELDRHKSKSNGKPSKIPKRKFNTSEAQTYRSELSRKALNPLFCKRRSYLPQPKHRTKDDLNIKDKKSHTRSKLNTTF